MQAFHLGGTPAVARRAPGIGTQRERRRAEPRRAQGSDGAPPATGIVIVDHGSRAKASNDMLLECVELYKRTTGAAIVEAAHMELADPSVADAVGELGLRLACSG